MSARRISARAALFVAAAVSVAFFASMPWQPSWLRTLGFPAALVGIGLGLASAAISLACLFFARKSASAPAFRQAFYLSAACLLGLLVGPFVWAIWIAIGMSRQ